QNTLGTSEITNDKDQFSIYPNPVKDVLFIKSKEKVVKAEAYDTAGRILNSISVSNNSVNISELAKGSYMIRLFTKDQVMVQKFIKN
ncbi:T9SS type A sorting domain-containing protein, partial [Chryseobacterium sp. LAM-KRS1]|uniref:T9SS type A sorting domain-containing protein n=1 Tax=Chryseobacterium sp. LAM-KRS1 TaxID=2715754 RepID=UPI0015571B47